MAYHEEMDEKGHGTETGWGEYFCIKAEREEAMG